MTPDHQNAPAPPRPGYRGDGFGTVARFDRRIATPYPPAAPHTLSPPVLRNPHPSQGPVTPYRVPSPQERMNRQNGKDWKLITLGLFFLCWIAITCVFLFLYMDRYLFN
ncbi:MAG: hypothetical protein RhofKO_31460 [Rhodothermales bacterium]